MHLSFWQIFIRIAIVFAVVYIWFNIVSFYIECQNKEEKHAKLLAETNDLRTQITNIDHITELIKNYPQKAEMIYRHLFNLKRTKEIYFPFVPKQ